MGSSNRSPRVQKPRLAPRSHREASRPSTPHRDELLYRAGSPSDRAPSSSSRYDSAREEHQPLTQRTLAEDDLSIRPTGKAWVRRLKPNVEGRRSTQPGP